MEDDATRKYKFPFPPYPAQVEFMDRAVSVLSAGGLGILELPTGGGKSMALLSACMAWLQKERLTMLAHKLGNAQTADSSLPDWVRSHLSQQQTDAVHATLQDWERQKLARTERMRLAEIAPTGAPKRPRNSDEGLETCAELLEDKRDRGIEKDATPNGPAVTRKYPQIVIASRTHSQLSQLVHEFRRSAWSQQFKAVTLGSRQLLCNLKSQAVEMTAEQVADFCRQAVDSGACSFKRCSGKVADRLLDASTPPLDIEEIRTLSLAPTVRGCGYFGTREAVLEADVIFVPYASLLNTHTRESLDICLKDNVLVIDEAHNIIEATNASNTVSLTASQVTNLRNHVKLYLGEYASKLSPQNVVKVKQLDVVLRKIVPALTATESELLSVMDASERFNWHALLQALHFMEDSELPRKLRGFAMRKKEQQPSAIYAFQSFVVAVTSSRSVFDRILIEDSRISFVSIDADSRLAAVVATTHATLLVGGTMRPIAELAVVAKEAKKPLEVFHGRHVVPSNRVFCRVFSPNDNFSFTFANLSNTQSSHWLDVLSAIKAVTTSLDCGGVVVFVTSYQMLANLKTVVDGALDVPVLSDGKTEDVEAVLTKFRAATAKSVCLLLSVVGGRLSEGIDFKDDLCRCVMLVGLPYPNVKDPILNEKMKYYDAKKLANPDTSISGQAFYEAKCVKAINQTVGRAIRHINDWAGVILLDARFRRPDVQSNLAEWLRNAGIREIRTSSTLADDFSEFVTRMRTTR